MTRRKFRLGAPRSARGFTLLEVLLAFVVFALSFATVLEITGGSMRAAMRAKEYTEAALLAQSLMDMVGTEIELKEGSLGGEAPGGYDWQLEISLYVPESPDDRTLELAEMSGTVLFWVDLDVAWGTERHPRSSHFSTVRSIMANQL